MKVAILGTGMVGRVIATKLRMLNHQVILGTRSVENTLNNEKKDAYGNVSFKEWHLQNSDIELKTFADAAYEAEILFNCTGGGVSLAALEAAGKSNLDGKVLIDLANPLDFSNGMPPTLNPVNTDSLGEQIQRKFPMLKVVKTLNTMNAGLMVDPGKLKGDHNVFICGNDEAAKATAREVLQSMGWKPNLIIDLGDITNARGTEMLLPIWLRLWNALETAEFNFHIQKN
ncbi:NAD(P)-binding domain-containing protein [Fulvivirga sp.]|uniref:NADPH-dependent F420 reductase n=1 Tax=Fulvivirga sp. TaxID=1931237 RepID=UPI0032ED0C68